MGEGRKSSGRRRVAEGIQGPAEVPPPGPEEQSPDESVGIGTRESGVTASTSDEQNAGGEEQEAESLRLSEFIREAVVKVPLTASDREGAIRELINVLVSAGELPRGLADAALEAVRERETIRPTGWKYGIALPNGRVQGLRRIVAGLGISPGGIPFGCRDGLPAKIVVLFLFPEARYARFAPGLQDIAEMFEDAALRERLLSVRSCTEAIEIIEEAEANASA